MPLVSALTKSLQVKIVYYGPGLSGKTTNLEKLATMLDKDRVGELMSLDTSGDRTLFFDWMPVELGKIRGFDVKIQLYTVPGQIRYDKTRQQVLRGVDGIVFVADSQRDAKEQNIFSFKNLRDNLALSGRDLEEIPLVIQCNKKDLPNTVTTREMAIALHAEHLPFIEASAQTGQGVVETLKLITRLTMKHVQAYLDPSQAKHLPSSAEALDGDSLLSKMLTSEVILKEHEETTPSNTTDESHPTETAATSTLPTIAGNHVPTPEEIDRADSSELTPIVEIKEDLIASKSAVEIEAEPPDELGENSSVVAEKIPLSQQTPLNESAFADRSMVPSLAVSNVQVDTPSTTPIDPDPVSTVEPNPDGVATVPQTETDTQGGTVAFSDEHIQEAVQTSTLQLQTALQTSSKEIEMLRSRIQEQEKRIHDLEMLVAKNTLNIQHLTDALSTLRRAWVDLDRHFESPNS